MGLSEAATARMATQAPRCSASTGHALDRLRRCPPRLHASLGQLANAFSAQR